MTVDILIPVRPDPSYYGFLPICLESVFRNVQQDIGQVFLVGAPGVKDIPGYPFDPKVQWVDENLLLRKIEEKEGISFAELPRLRVNWFKQQILKVYGYLVSNAEYLLIVDADLCFLEPISFLKGSGACNFYLEQEYHVPYFETIRRLTGLEKNVEKSFVSDHILMKTSVVREMLQFIEQRCQKPFPAALEEILEEGAATLSTNFSEYELYGTFFRHFHSDLIGEFHENPICGIPHFYLPRSQEWTYQQVRERVEYPYFFLPMIADHAEVVEPPPFTIKRLEDWRPPLKI